MSMSIQNFDILYCENRSLAKFCNSSFTRLLDQGVRLLQDATAEERKTADKDRQAQQGMESLIRGEANSLQTKTELSATLDCGKQGVKTRRPNTSGLVS